MRVYIIQHYTTGCADRINGVNNEVCHEINGSCLNGCDKGY